MNEHIRNEIIVRSLRGHSQREIASTLRVSRNTIKSVIDERKADRDGLRCSDAPTSSKKRSSVLDHYESQIRELLIRYPKMKVVEINRRLKAIGYNASYTILRLRVKQLRQQLAKDRLEKNRAPGAAGKVMYRDVLLRLVNQQNVAASLFIFRLEYSGRTYMHLAPSNSLAYVICVHLRAFDHFSGVAAKLMYIDVPPLLAIGNGPNATFNQTFLRFANHYGFRPSLSSDPGDAMGLLAVQLERQVLSHSDFRGLDHANDAISTWMLGNCKNARSSISSKSNAASHESNFLIPLPQQPWMG